WLASQTSRIKIGSGIFQMPGRSPAMTAMTAATLDILSNGRLILGLGTSGPQVAEGWHGQRFGKQLQRTREYVAILRKAVARERLEEGAARAGRSLNGFDIAPTVNVSIDDDVDRARDTMRPVLALYVGGMGSREKNFYNQAVQRLGYEDVARKVQDLYLDGKKQEAAAALPGDLIDKITLCGPPGRIKDRLEAYKEAGVGTM